MKLTILGSGSPEAHAARASSGYLIETADAKILFDCGGGSMGRLLQAGHLPSQITHLFFSHLHSDHMMDYARLIHAAWDEGGPPMAVYGPAPLARITEKLFGPDGVFAHDLNARTLFKPSQDVWRARGGTLPRPWPGPVVTEISPGFAFDAGDWRLTTCEVPHAQPHLACLALSIEAEGRKLTYSGDAGLCDSLIALAQDADLLIHWCYRMEGEPADDIMRRLSPSPSQIGKVAAAARARRLLLTHIRKQHDTEPTLSAAMAAVAQTYDGPAGIASDGQVVTL